MTQFYAHSIEGRPESEWETMHQQWTACFCRQFLRRSHPALAPWGDLLGRRYDLAEATWEPCL
jgi:hypothetical protein